MLRRVRMRARGIVLGAWVELRRRTGGAAYKRWSDEENLDSDWDERTFRLGEFVPPDSTVLEFGAGRRVLEERLPEGVTYIPSDLVDRGPGTFVCNLNKLPLPDFPAHDVVLLSGLLEYVNDVPHLITTLSSPPDRTGLIVCSYAIAEKNDPRRRMQGWVNDYTTSSLREAFARAGYLCTHQEDWHRQRLFAFELAAGHGHA